MPRDENTMRRLLNISILPVNTIAAPYSLPSDHFTIHLPLSMLPPIIRLNGIIVVHSSPKSTKACETLGVAAEKKKYLLYGKPLLTYQ